MNVSVSAGSASRRYQCGEETRQRVIDAAVVIFGRQGYAGTSTRDIAAAAQVNTPAIQYYFGGKLGLYQAAIDQLTGLVASRIAPAMQECRVKIAAGASLDELLAALSQVQDCLIDAFFADPEGDEIRKLLAWEAAESSEAISDHVMKERIGLPIFTTFQRAVEHVVTTPMPRTEIELHALSLMSASMIFHFNQCRVLDMLGWSKLDADRLAMLKAVAHKHLTYALTALSRA